MLLFFAKWTVIGFGVFFLLSGLLMLFSPQRANQILRKAGSTNLINYGEISIRMIPAAALILSSDLSKHPEVFRIFGWFMLGTSLVLFFVPKRLHHRFSVKSAEILKPFYFQLISPIAFLIGAFLIYCVI